MRRPPDFQSSQLLIQLVPASEQQAVPTWMRLPLRSSRVRPSKNAGPGRAMPRPPLKVSCRPRATRLGREDSCASPGGSGLELRTGAGSFGEFGSALHAGRGALHAHAANFAAVHMPVEHAGQDGTGHVSGRHCHTCRCAKVPGLAGRRLHPAQGLPNSPRCRVSPGRRGGQPGGCAEA